MKLNNLVISWILFKDKVDRFYDFAKQHLTVWKDDQNGLEEHLNGERALGVQNARLMVAFVDDAYLASHYCGQEINYANTLGQEILVVKLQEGLELEGKGSAGLIANSKDKVSTVR